MSLPNSRDVTASANAPVPSATFNAIQDWIVSLYGGSRAPITRTKLPVNDEGVNTSWNQAGGYRVATAASATFDVALDVKEGDRIISFAFMYFIPAGLTPTCSLKKIDSSGTVTTVATASGDQGFNAWFTKEETLSTPETVATGDAYWLSFSIDDTTRVSVISLTTDRV